MSTPGRLAATLALLLLPLPGPGSALLAQGSAVEPPLPVKVDFNRDIRPLLSNLCYHCHGPDKTKREAELRFDTRAGLFSKHDDIHIVVPGKPKASELYRRITAGDADERMPPSDSGLSLTPRQVQLLERWIAQGALWQPHWSFIPPRRPPLPAVSDPSWPANPIDHFILARLDRAGLAPSPAASRTTLLRRVTLDLTGLPPSPAAIASFLAASGPGSYQRLVDRLLTSPRLGEHLATSWLDAARYADTSGYQNDGPRDMWRWRDWVLAAINGNMAFDTFTIEQLAGDLLPAATLDQRIATAFNRNHRGNSEGGVIPEEYQVEYVVDRVDTTATVWLGLTLKCARCHEHKYDPFSQEEFYRVFAYFNNIPENGRAIKEGNSPPYIQAPTPAQQQQQQELATALAAAERTALKLLPVVGTAQRRWEAIKGSRLPAETDWSIADGLIAHFPLDGNAENLIAPPTRPIDNTADKLAAAKQATATTVRVLGGEAVWTPGRVGQATALSGGRWVDAGVATAKFAYRDKFTLSAWVYPTRVDTGTILSKMTDEPEGKGYYVDLDDGRIRINLVARWLDDSIRVESVGKLPTGRWTHLAVTYDATRLASGLQLYLDGRPVPLKVNYDFLNQTFPATEPLRLGGGGGPDGRFAGRLDEVRIYNRDLDRREISILATPEPLLALVAIPPAKRTPGQSAKLRDYFLARHGAPAHRKALGRLQELRREQRLFLESLPTVMVMQELPSPRQTFLLKRGQYDRPGRRVTPGTPAILPPLAPLPAGRSSNRLSLARWLVNKQNPLTARVITNRTWQGIFGNGLVRTTEDFGSQGDRPSHPLLLDWLATELHRSDWDIKSLLRTIVTSATYRQSSRLTPELLGRDPENRLLARAPRYRLSAAIIRDQALFVAGLLNEQIGGPSLRPYQPEGLWKEIASTTDYNQSHGGDLYRRSLYTYWKRTVTPPTMLTFDASTREACTVRTSRTNTPLQALTLMNDVTFTEASRVLAERILADGPAEDAGRLRLAFLLTLARPPSEAEAKVLLAGLAHQRQIFAARPAAAAQLASTGESPRREGVDVVDVASWTTLAGILLNLDETISRE